MFFLSKKIDIDNFNVDSVKELSKNKRKQYIDKKMDKYYRAVMKMIIGQANNGFYSLIIPKKYNIFNNTNEINDELFDRLQKLLEEKGFHAHQYSCNGSTRMKISWE